MQLIPTHLISASLEGKIKQMKTSHQERKLFDAAAIYIYVCDFSECFQGTIEEEQNNDVRQSASVCFVVLVQIIYYHYIW